MNYQRTKSKIEYKKLYIASKIQCLTEKNCTNELHVINNC